MIFIIGGSYQGKTDFTVNNFGLDISEITEGTQSLNELEKAICIRHFENLVSSAIKENKDPLKLTANLLSVNPDVIIIMTEIGSGIIPIEKSERIYREFVGKTGCLLAEHAQKVIRLTCGIPLVIKGISI
ncbi:MAG: bifunctional adenosylcobinamide kinase/adenosylcobinamide-phosphate guanylyltransferase [Clostridium sp.]|nr:bifunctional adenosylcobinamide kinase/adenosylcobinamide-phosphate guanylyltransferase [Clostridium sp.]MCM1546993.1 bifunctional adenosylcobinamide kinase/adenosylcobinamide-phosphate guanylyltransferase [Ruminococcus sp.]